MTWMTVQCYALTLAVYSLAAAGVSVVQVTEIHPAALNSLVNIRLTVRVDPGLQCLPEIFKIFRLYLFLTDT